MASAAGLRVVFPCVSLASCSPLLDDAVSPSSFVDFFGQLGTFHSLRSIRTTYPSLSQSTAHPWPLCIKKRFTASTRKHARGGALVARAAASTSIGTTTTLRILLANQVNFGERHAIFGAGDALKNWQEAVEMEWTDAGWVTDLGALQPGEKIEFKAVIVHGNGGVQWENGPNRVIQLPEEGGSYAVKLHWENTAEELRLEGTEGQTVETEAPEENESGSDENGGQNSESGISVPESKWQPRDIEVIEHTREGGGTWDTTNLNGPAAQPVEGDKHGVSRWPKLEVVKGLVMPDERGKQFRMLSFLREQLTFQQTPKVNGSKRNTGDQVGGNGGTAGKSSSGANKKQKATATWQRDTFVDLVVEEIDEHTGLEGGTAWAVPPSDSPSYNGQVTSPIEPDATREWSTPVATRAQTGSNRVDAQERTGTAVLDTEVCEREKQEAAYLENPQLSHTNVPVRILSKHPSVETAHVVWEEARAQRNGASEAERQATGEDSVGLSTASSARRQENMGSARVTGAAYVKGFRTCPNPECAQSIRVAYRTCPHCQLSLTSHKEKMYVLERQRTRDAARNSGDNNRFDVSKPLARLHKQADKISDVSGGAVEVIILAVKYSKEKKVADLTYSSTSEVLSAIVEQQGLKRVAEAVASKFVEKLLEGWSGRKERA